MRYKEDNDNRYRVNFMIATEELMDALTVESFCREYGWEWVDENEFVWDMDYEEA